MTRDQRTEPDKADGDKVRPETEKPKQAARRKRKSTREMRPTLDDRGYKTR